MFGAHIEKALSPYVLVLQVECISGSCRKFQRSDQVVSDVPGVLLDIAGRDHSMIYKQKEDA